MTWITRGCHADDGPKRLRIASGPHLDHALRTSSRPRLGYASTTGG
ncbi:hypothetical protein SBD_7645 [Streptomyces bottropensis ATCC 25435]|uniref:Uncharacterized protein n=1 Tax=Streptomyces bottropensis ATCC 25435 TaxID=1054862 RepID=M3EPG5_9ACTN|nr:hypothetical protein SBD_7645 [Streptomyces bottropensis ATCC 25435]